MPTTIVVLICNNNVIYINFIVSNIIINIYMYI